MEPEQKENETDVFIIHPPLSPKDKDIFTEDVPEKKKNSFLHIDKAMIRYKLHFFLLIGGLGATLPYIPIFAMNRVGVSATALATVLTSQQFLFIFTKPLIGYITDYFNKLKVVIFILAVTQGTVFFLLLPIPKIKSSDAVISQRLTFEATNGTFLRHELCNLDKPYDIRFRAETLLDINVNDVICAQEIPIFPKIPDKCLLSIIAAPNTSTGNNQTNFLSPFQAPSTSEINSSISTTQTSSHEVSPSSDVICKDCCDLGKDCYVLLCPQTSNSSDPTPHQESQFLAPEFWMFAIVTTITLVCINALFTLSDTALCESAQKSGSDFGQQRLWGAFGWGIMSPIGGLLNDYFDDYLVSWIIMGIMTSLSLWNLYKMDIVKPNFSKNILRDVGAVFRSGEFLAFEVGVLMNGMALSVIWFYLVWFLTTIGGSRFLCGLVHAVQCFAGEMPCMFYSGRLIKKVGHFNVITLALLGYFSRFLWYSFLEDPWLVLPIEVIHGLTYGLFYPNIASFAKKSAKPGTEATTQTILFSTHDGLGAGLGCMLAGLGFDYLGGHRTFFIASVCAGCGMLINIGFTLCIRSQKNKDIDVTMEREPHD